MFTKKQKILTYPYGHFKIKKTWKRCYALCGDNIFYTKEMCQSFGNTLIFKFDFQKKKNRHTTRRGHPHVFVVL